jgi:hypothetical protein
LPVAGLNDNFNQGLYYAQETQYDAANQSTAGLQAQITVANNNAANAVVTANAADAAADAATIAANNATTFTQAGTGATTRTVESKLRDVVSVKDFGAVGDGVTDDTVALQNALNSNQIIFVPPGKYRTTATLTVNPTQNRNTGFIGLTNATRYPYSQQTGGPIWNGTKEPVIFYDGTTSSMAAVISASAAAVGVEPSATFHTTVWTFTLRDITLDANSKAGYGLFTARVQDLQINHLRARGATVAGVSINGTYSGSARSVRCYLNPGRGFELGAADDRFSWTLQDKVNAFYIYDLHADANGSSATFRENNASLLKDNCGVYFGPHRSSHIFGVVSENNFGANIVFEPSSSGNSIHGFYTELGCKYTPSGAGSDAISLGYATRQWGLIFIGSAGAQHCRLVDGILAGDGIWLTGTEPTPSRKEAGFEIYQCSLSSGVKADWANYRLVNSAAELETITGSQPTGAFTVKGGIQFGANLTTLNNYEEATFTPALAGITTAGTGWAYTMQTGSYTRIGDRVHAQGRIILSAVSTDATGQIAITGLPFTVKNANNYFSAAVIANVLNTTTSVISFEGVTPINTSRINLHKRTAASTSASSVVLGDLSATTSLTFQVSYVAA